MIPEQHGEFVTRKVTIFDNQLFQGYFDAICEYLWTETKKAFTIDDFCSMDLGEIINACTDLHEEVSDLLQNYHWHYREGYNFLDDKDKNYSWATKPGYLHWEIGFGFYEGRNNRPVSIGWGYPIEWIIRAASENLGPANAFVTHTGRPMIGLTTRRKWLMKNQPDNTCGKLRRPLTDYMYDNCNRPS